MLSREAELILCETLMTIANYEKQVEIIRQVLNEQPDFEPYTAFKYLDYSCEGTLTPSTFLDFLIRYGHDITYADGVLFIKEWDLRNLGKLSYSDFMRMVLPLTNDALRRVVTQRASYPGKELSYDTIFALYRMLEREMLFLRNVEEQRGRLGHVIGFSVRSVFDRLDSFGRGYITEDDFERILAGYGYDVYFDDVSAIFRRLDKDGDGRVTYSELSRGLLSDWAREEFVNLSHSTGFSPASPLKRSGSIGRDQSFFNNSQGSIRSGDPQMSISELSPMRAGFRHSQLSPAKRSVKMLQGSQTANTRYRTPQKKVQSKAMLKRSSIKSTPQKATHKSQILKQSPIKPSPELRELANAFTEQIMLDKDLEEIRRQLSLRQDFNLQDAFRMIDVGGKGFFTASQLSECLESLEVFTEKQSLYLLFRHFDRKNRGRVYYDDFCELFLPKKSEYSMLLQNRLGNNVKPRQRKNIFSIETREILAKAYRLHLDIESATESLRQRLTRSPTFNMYAVFKSLDLEDKGYFTINEFRALLRHYGFTSTEKDLIALMNRYDSNKDGKVSYNEFTREITPKSPRKIY